MKVTRVLAAVCCLSLLIASLFSTAYAEPAVEGFTVEWIGESPTLTAVANWTYEGGQYEMALTGVKSKLPDETLAAVAEGFHLKKDVALTDTALTDAEKFTHFIPHRAGASDTWVIIDKVREDPAWGDSLQCWAASASNMLTSTGWSLRATDPATGATFTGEDAVFSFFTKCFVNDGNYQEDAIRRFFEGSELPELVAEGKAESDALLPGEDTEKYMSSVMISDSGPEGVKILSGMAGEIKKGAALGISVDMCERVYPLKADPYICVDREKGRYREAVFSMFDEEAYAALPEFYWTYDACGTIVLLTKDGDTFKDGEGNTVDPMGVKKDHLYYDEKAGTYLVPEPEKIGLTYTVTGYVEHPESEVDTENPKIYAGVGNGSHAITVGGYIKELGKASAEDGGIRALFIADSDNDANFWKIDENTPKKEDRPNTYKLCYAEKAEISGVTTLKMNNYIEDGETYVGYACLLYPKGAGQETAGK